MGEQNGGVTPLYMTNAEVESFISYYSDNKDKESLDQLKGLLQSGGIVLVSEDDDEPKPKVRVRKRSR